MAAIRPSDVSIRRVYQVDCAVCQQAVEPDAYDTINGAFTTPEGAREARQRHVEEHARGEWG